MIQKLLEHSEMRRILIMLGAAGVCGIVGAGIYAAAMHAVTPTRMGNPSQNTNPAHRETVLEVVRP